MPTKTIGWVFLWLGRKLVKYLVKCLVDLAYILAYILQAIAAMNPGAKPQGFFGGKQK